jgi:hypothetical protein
MNEKDFDEAGNIDVTLAQPFYFSFGWLSIFLNIEIHFVSFITALSSTYPIDLKVNKFVSKDLFTIQKITEIFYPDFT